MTAYFLDSSAATKLYVAEGGTTWVAGLVDPARLHEVFVVRVTAVEIAAALFRRARSGAMPIEDAARAVGILRADLQRTYRVVELTPVVSDLAFEMAARHGLRGYDCVQLAAALFIHRRRAPMQLSPLELVSADVGLNQAAQAEGMAVVDPNDYP